MIPHQFSRSKKTKASSYSPSAIVGVCLLDELFRLHPPAKGEMKRLGLEVTTNVRKAQMGLQSLPKHTIDLVTDVFWFDQVPTDLLICGHA